MNKSVKVQLDAQIDKVSAIVSRVESGDTSALPSLRHALKESSGIWERVGNLSDVTIGSWLNLAFERNHLEKESCRLWLNTLKADLTDGKESPIEKLIIDQIALCHLQYDYFALQLTQKYNGLSVEQREYSQRRVGRAQKQLLAALKTLAQVRRLLRPSIRIKYTAEQ